MYRDVAQWAAIRRQIFDGVSLRQIVRETGINRATVRKMRDHPLPIPCGPRRSQHPKLGPHTDSIQRILRENSTLPSSAQLSVTAIYERLRAEEGFSGSYSCVNHYVRTITRDQDGLWESVYEVLISLEKKQAIAFLSLLSHAESSVISAERTEQVIRHAARRGVIPSNTDALEQARQVDCEWMRAVLQKRVRPEALRRDIGNVPDLQILLRRLYEGRLSERNRSMVVLANHHGLSCGTVCAFLGISRQTRRRYLRLFEAGGHAALFAPEVHPTSKFDNEAIRQAIFAVLHQPPSNYGINRTSWIMSDLSRVLREAGQPVGSAVIRKVTKAAGYRWRKARVVLTSPDPDYTEKLDRIHSILSELRPDEAFFSIDEFGPFAVKMQPGRALTAPGEQRIVPQWQKSRGCLIITAALELSSNQVTHFYSSKKNTAEMIRMMEALVEQYHDRRKIYLSWDAASWHMSKRLSQHIEEHNAAVPGHRGPLVETAPLPSRAQFLNVIESVFSGMARAIIHNSDYKTLDDAKAAVDRYFADRNAHFRQHPRRAGAKIWGREREAAAFSEANNCKDPRYYR